MASTIFTAAGQEIGQNLIKGGIGKTIGYVAGNLIGNMIDNKLSSTPLPRIYGTRLENLSVQTSTYGAIIPMIYGKFKISGNIIWANTIKEHQQVLKKKISSSANFFKSDKQKVINFKYFVDFAIGIGEGPIDDIERVWANNELIDLKNFIVRIYKGTEEQMPDPMIESIMGKGNVPAYRGLAYIVFENFPLELYGNQLPNFSFEVKKRDIYSNNKSEKTLEEMITSMVMIPGSGEFVYDTEVQYKVSVVKDEEDELVETSLRLPINMNNKEGKADSLVSLDQLQKTCPNLKWVAPVVTWFADNLDIGKAILKPGVEYCDLNSITVPDQWKVGHYTRENAYLISQSKEYGVAYGGSVNDLAIIRYLEELHNRKLKIMFYPMFFMDLPGKPWRGRMSGKIEDVEYFFQRPGGYNNFIIHYAELVQGKVDAFVIGSELVGITKITDGKGYFPAVKQLIKLAELVKDILGPRVKVTYAADWSEYHHTDGGWYHLDELWSSPSIDVVGIDAYFPLTNSENILSANEIMKGWESGEGYDYYYKNSEHKENPIALAPPYAWKNIKWWWENYHYNPNGRKTTWQPKMKKIWFTEYGFPSVDKASNQPNVFYDPESNESKLPHLSRGKIDIRSQRLGITATELQWADSEMIEEKFLWTWDARPYPSWPDNQAIWRDGSNWKTGHWVNGKLGLITLDAVVSNLCLKAGLNSEDIDVTQLSIPIDGYVIASDISARKAIEVLQQAYFFDCVESEGILKFVLRNNSICHVIGKDDLLRNNDEISSHLLQIVRKHEIELPFKTSLLFPDKNNNYRLTVASATQHNTLSKDKEIIELPLAFDNSYALRLAEITNNNSWSERFTYKFSLPLKYLFLEPSDVVKIEIDDKAYIMRILQIELTTNKILNIQATSEDISQYDFSFDYSNDLVSNSLMQSKSVMDNLEMIIYKSKLENQILLLVGVINNINTKISNDCYINIRNQKNNKEDLFQIRKFATSGQIISWDKDKATLALKNPLEEVSQDLNAIINNKIFTWDKAIIQNDNLYQIEGIKEQSGKISITSLTAIEKNKSLLLDDSILQIEIDPEIEGQSFELELIVNNNISCKKIVKF